MAATRFPFHKLTNGKGQLNPCTNHRPPQLGEILKAYGHFQEAALHLRHVLELRPNHEPALAILKDMEATPDSTVHVYTLLIIGISTF